jgi:hypothetical protein
MLKTVCLELCLEPPRTPVLGQLHGPYQLTALVVPKFFYTRRCRSSPPSYTQLCAVCSRHLPFSPDHFAHRHVCSVRDLGLHRSQLERTFLTAAQHLLRQVLPNA